MLVALGLFFFHTRLIDIFKIKDKYHKLKDKTQDKDQGQKTAQPGRDA